MGSPGRWWASPRIQIALLAALCGGGYANGFHHAFQLDDAHVLQNNLSIRSLANIPQYFVDPATFTSLRANVDYRPVLQVTYALNYAMGGYDTWWWHLTQLVLHAACVAGLYFLAKRILELIAPDGQYTALVPILAAAVFAVHPTGSGVVNYLSARSSLLTAAFLLPSILLYMAPRGKSGSIKMAWLAVLLFGLALFTKVEAIAALAVYFLYEMWVGRAEGRTSGRNEREDEKTRGRDPAGFFGALLHTLNLGTLRRLAPFLLVAAGYFVVRARLMAPFEFEESRRAAGVSALDYLLTQTVVWWQYVLNWFAPVNLVADQGDYPVYRSLLSGPVPFAIGGWLVVGALLLASWKRRPYLAFLALSALALLSPTSSIAPLAEMLNEHRPYLPLAVLSLCWMIPVGMGLTRAARAQPAKGLVATGLVAGLAGLGAVTWQRNRVFTTERSYLEDVIAKAPSGRALNNYGLLFLREGNYPRALELFQEAVKYTPYWHTVHINLGIVYRQLQDSARTQEHFDRAVDFDRFSGTALTWRGQNYLEQKRYREAANDFERAAPRSLELYRLCKGLATAYAGLGEVERSVDQTTRCLELDAGQTAKDIVAISTPFFESAALTRAGLEYFERLDGVIPNTWWVHYNIGTLAGRLGDSTRAAAEHARGEALKPKS